MKIAVIGRSHAVCLGDAIYRYAEEFSNISIASVFTNLFEPIWDWTNTANPLKEEIKTALTDAVKDADAVALVIQGNQHSILSLVEHEPKIDFVFGSRNIAHIQEDAVLVPEILIRNWFSNCLLELRLIARYLRSLYSGPVFCLGPPPPIENSAEVRKRLDSHFLSSTTQPSLIRISPALFRYKCWLLMDDVYRMEATQEALRFLPVPPETITKQGFLAESAWDESATHANAWYGHARIHQIIDAVESINGGLNG